MISTVIFDYGGVLSSPLAPALRTLERRFDFPPHSLDELLFGGQHIDSDDNGGDPIDGAPSEGNALHATWHALERGDVEFDVFLDALLTRAPDVIGRDLTATDFIVFLAEMEIGTHWTLVHFIRELRERGYAIGLLTNNVAAFGDHWKATIPLDELFDVVVDSSDVGLRKPDPEIYLLTAHQLKAEPTECVFIDDNRDNVEAAAALGMKTVRMRLDPLEAEAALRELLAVSPRL
ncbi:MAG: HAD family phosphatase [Acidimicrobiia bacterium]